MNSDQMSQAYFLYVGYTSLQGGQVDKTETVIQSRPNA